MAIYKRYNTRKTKLDTRIIIAVSVVAVIFALTVFLGWHLDKKADGIEPLYTGQPVTDDGSGILAPLSEKSVQGKYVEAEDLSDFVAENDEIWASTWLYRDGVSLFATETDKRLEKDVKNLPKLTSFELEFGTLGLFEVSGIYEDELVKGIITEYERSLLAEFASSGLDETVLVFREATEENYREALAFAESVQGAKVVCVPYTLLSSQEFFSAAADKGIPVALLADGVSAEQLESDISTYAFYFTKYNIRLVLSKKDAGLVDVLAKHTVLNYQFYS